MPYTVDQNYLEKSLPVGKCLIDPCIMYTNSDLMKAKWEGNVMFDPFEMWSLAIESGDVSCMKNIFVFGVGKQNSRHSENRSTNSFWQNNKFSAKTRNARCFLFTSLSKTYIVKTIFESVVTC